MNHESAEFLQIRDSGDGISEGISSQPRLDENDSITSHYVDAPSPSCPKACDSTVTDAWASVGNVTSVVKNEHSRIAVKLQSPPLFSGTTTHTSVTELGCAVVVGKRARTALVRCPSCYSKQVLITFSNVYCYRCYRDSYVNPDVKSQLNGVNGEATNSDDVPDRRVRKEAKNRMLHQKPGEDKHRKVPYGPKPTEAPPAEAQPEKKNEVVVAPPPAREPHRNEIVRRRIYFNHTVPRTSSAYFIQFVFAIIVVALLFAPFERQILEFHLTKLLQVFYQTPHLRGFSAINALRDGDDNMLIALAMSRVRFSPTTYLPYWKWGVFHLVRYVLQFYAVVQLVLYYFILLVRFIGYEVDTPYLLVLKPFLMPFDYHDSKVVHYHNNLAGFNAYQNHDIDLTLYKVLQKKHALVNPSEHLLQVLMSTASSCIDSEQFAEHHDTYRNTCELYFQDMLRYRVRMQRLGVRRNIPVE